MFEKVRRIRRTFLFVAYSKDKPICFVAKKSLRGYLCNLIQK